MVSTREDTYEAQDGVLIHARQWLPDKKPARGLQLSHGIMEHIARYDAFARFLAEHGILVVGNDHRGHGKTAAGPDDLGYFADRDGWMTAVRDMHTVYARTVEANPGLPYFMLGHSMGSFLLRTYLTCYQDALSGAIISGTGQTPYILNRLGLTVAAYEKKKITPRGRSPRLYRLCFGSLNKKFTAADAALGWLSSDREVRMKYADDPYCGFIPTAGMFSDMLGGIMYNARRKNLKKMQKTLPVYFFSGALDPVGSYGKGAARAYRSFLRAGCTDVTLKLYPEGRHEMLNEQNKDDVYMDVLAWIESRLPGNMECHSF
jgi:alpha-beta hydrolase superfamily lysophospholipase